MNEETAKAIRKVFHIPDAELLTIWSFTGLSGCPVATPDIGFTNCPLDFEDRGVPTELEPWMRGNCDDESWRSRWKDILKQCKQCQGKPRPSKEEEQRSHQIRQSLFKGRRGNGTGK